MKRWILFALAALLALGIVLVGNWRSVQRVLPTRNERPEIPTIETRNPPPSPTTQEVTSNISSQLQLPVDVPAVNAQRLLADLKALSFERYSSDERAQARTYITEALQAIGWQPRSQVFQNGINLVAERSGTNPEAGTILVAAHYDTVQGSPGADDNASAVASVLETARLLAARPTAKTLKVAFFDLEEQGLQGSFAFTARDENLNNLQGAVILEMLGFACYQAGCQQYPEGLPIAPPSDRGDFLAVIGDQEHLPLLNAFQVAKQANLPTVITLAIPLKGLMTPDLLRSDHAPFWYRGIGALMVTDTANFRTPHYHQASDTAATIVPDFFVGSTQLVVNAITTLLES
jgi:hypothetical protein